MELPSQKSKASHSLLSLFAGCPDNAFQKVQTGMDSFSIVQRLGAIVRNGMKLFGVGFCASMLGEKKCQFEIQFLIVLSGVFSCLGVGMTNALTSMRQAVDPKWSPPNKPQDVIPTSIAYGKVYS